MEEFEKLLDATTFITAEFEYHNDFKNLLYKIYESYEKMVNIENNLPKLENKIRDILVDKYLVKNILDYTFKKEENNNLGRVDIYIIDKLDDSKPHFIIECKLLDGKKNLNSEYIRSGIQRLLTEHYYIENSLYTNAMIGFVVSKLDINKNIDLINILVTKLLNNFITIINPITIHDNNIYKSVYKTSNDKGTKEFIIYHLMMDFSSICG